MGPVRNVDLVLEGGGVKGVALLGAVLTLSEAGYRFPRIAGTSVGALVGTLVAAYQRAGRDLHDLLPVMESIDYRRFADGGGLQKMLGPIGDGLGVLLHDGAHPGRFVEELLTPLLGDVGVHTWADLRIDDDPDTSLLPYQRYAAVCLVTDLTRRVSVRLPWDYDQYGLDRDTQSVAAAVHASTAVPFYFRPVEITTPRGTCTWIDGGLLDNFPITVFDRTDGLPERWPTWGVKLSAEPPADTPDHPVRGAPFLALACLGALTNEDSRRYRLDEEGVNRRTVYVDTGTVGALDFDLTRQQVDGLLTAGREAATRFLALQD
ncbi:patatin-like phospholipase family protein [Tsukamurella soli]|uniref:Patatin-like phospholipase family protein n=1 Tax=Tsukamurella soli TaxID=644556 RepID=A0ABP8KFL9_9ACTN